VIGKQVRKGYGRRDNLDVMNKGKLWMGHIPPSFKFNLCSFLRTYIIQAKLVN